MLRLPLYLRLSRAGIALLAIGAALPHCQAQDNPSPAAPISPPTQATANRIDPEALALLKKVETTMLGLKTYQAECWTTITDGPKKDGTAGRTAYHMATLIAVKPNLLRYDNWEMAPGGDPVDTSTWKRKNESPDVTFVCNGKTFWTQFGTTHDADKHTEPDFLNALVEPCGGFYTSVGSPYSSTMLYQKERELLEVRREGTAVVDGVTCDCVFTHTLSLFVPQWSKLVLHRSRGPMRAMRSILSTEKRTYWYIAADGLVHRQVEEAKYNHHPGYTHDAILRHIVVNAPAPDSKTVFTYTPPPSKF